MSLGWRTLPTLGMKGTWRSKNKAELKEIKLLRRKMGRSDLVWFGIEENGRRICKSFAIRIRLL